MSHPAIVIGAGVDELVAAHYLARAGHRVCVLRETGAGEDARPAAWVPRHVVRALALDNRGLVVETPEPWLSAPLPGGGRLELSSDIGRAAGAIRALSARDAAQWPEFCRRIHVLAALLESIYAQPPPDPLTRELGAIGALVHLGFRVRGLGRQSLEDLLRFTPMSIADLLDEWFESDALKGALGAAGVMHLAQGPRSSGTAFNFLHHQVGNPAGTFRQPSSNIREVLTALPGIEIRNVEVAQIQVRQGRVAGVALTGGEALEAALVVSGADPRRTLLELADPGWLDPQLVRAVRSIRSRGVVAEATLTLDRAPDFSVLTMAPSLDYLERAYDHAKYGRVSAEPYLEARDAGAEADEQHRVRVHVQYAPGTLKDGAWDTAQCDRLMQSVVAKLSEHARGFGASVIRQRLLAPADLERERGWPQGQTYQAELGLDQILWMRPVPQLAHYRTPIRGLYLCGPAMHPGGGGAAGANAARTLLRDLRRPQES